MNRADIALYDDAFFDAQIEGSLRSARVIVPIIMELVNPRSVIDIGCGRAAWLRAFEENGVEQVRGVDGHYLDLSKLLIQPAQFLQIDLQQPFKTEDRYDLALCLEVAEHLPAKVGQHLVRTLTRLAPIVLFSAAIPGQTGTHHINEQWPPYWRALFEEQGYRGLNPIRRRIWQDGRVEWWYRQNIMMYASEETITRSPALQAELTSTQEQLECIHPAILDRLLSVRGLLRELPKAAWRWLLRLQR